MVGFISRINMLYFEFWGRVYDIPGYLKYYNLKEGDIVVDAGAYSGLFTRYASKKVGKNGKVIAFEPDPENFEILKQRFKKIKNVILVQKGLFNCCSVLRLKRHPFYGSIASMITKENSSKDNLGVLVTTLDYELKRLGITSVNFIKMDIEGAEIEAVYGMKKTLKNSHPNLAIACYHKRDNQETSILLKKILRKYYNNLKIGNRLHKTLFAQNKYAKSDIKINIKTSKSKFKKLIFGF